MKAKEKPTEVRDHTAGGQKMELSDSEEEWV